MESVMFDFYQITYRRRTYYILQPEDLGQFWVFNRLDGGCNWMETTFYGNTKGLMAWRNACGALSGDASLIVYFPCRRSREVCEIFSFFQVENWIAESIGEFLDLVLMKPGTLKISDWKEIRALLAKAKVKKRRICPEYILENRKVKEKYQYRDEKKSVIRFDTLFYNFSHYEYLTLASELKDFLNHSREKEFMEDIGSGEERLRGDALIFEVERSDVWVTFWDNDLFRKGQLEKRRESMKE